MISKKNFFVAHGVCLLIILLLCFILKPLAWLSCILFSVSILMAKPITFLDGITVVTCRNSITGNYGTVFATRASRFYIYPVVVNIIIERRIDEISGNFSFYSPNHSIEYTVKYTSYITDNVIVSYRTLLMNTINYSRKTTLDDSIMFATNQIRVCFERALYKRINDSATIKDPRTSYLDKIPVEILGRTNIEQIEYVAQVLQST